MVYTLVSLLGVHFVKTNEAFSIRFELLTPDLGATPYRAKLYIRVLLLSIAKDHSPIDVSVFGSHRCSGASNLSLKGFFILNQLRYPLVNFS